MDDEQRARELGSWLGSVPSLIAPIARQACLRLLARRGRVPGEGLRSHPLGRALLEGVAQGAGGDEQEREEAAERARRSLEHGLMAARVEARLGLEAAGRLSPWQLEHLVHVPGAHLDLLAAWLRAHPRRIEGLVPLRRLIRRLVAAQGGAPAPQGQGRLEDSLFRRALRNVVRAEGLIGELTGQEVALYLGPPGLAEKLGLELASGLGPPPAGAEGERSAPAEPEATTLEEPAAEGEPDSALPPLRSLATICSSPASAAFARLRAWCRRMAPLLTPSLQERLLLPLPPPA